MATTGTAAALDMEKLNAFMGKAVGDVGAGLHAVLVVIGDRLAFIKPWLIRSR